MYVSSTKLNLPGVSYFTRLLRKGIQEKAHTSGVVDQPIDYLTSVHVLSESLRLLRV